MTHKEKPRYFQDEIFQDSKLSKSDCYILLKLQSLSKKTAKTQKNLIDWTGISKSNLSERISHLVKLGYIEVEGRQIRLKSPSFDSEKSSVDRTFNSEESSVERTKGSADRTKSSAQPDRDYISNNKKNNKKNNSPYLSDVVSVIFPKGTSVDNKELINWWINQKEKHNKLDIDPVAQLKYESGLYGPEGWINGIKMARANGWVNINPNSVSNYQNEKQKIKPVNRYKNFQTVKAPEEEGKRVDRSKIRELIKDLETKAA